MNDFEIPFLDTLKKFASQSRGLYIHENQLISFLLDLKSPLGLDFTQA